MKFTYLLLLLMLVAGFLVIVARNPVISLFYLVIAFLNASLLLLFYNCEFLAFLFLIVYIGAIIVLFLFIVMMLNIKIIELNAKIIKYVPIGVFIIFIFLLEMIHFIYIPVIEFDLSNYFKNFSSYNFLGLHLTEFFYLINTYQNISGVASLLFYKYAFLFIVCGMILLVAMIGSIILTLFKKKLKVAPEATNFIKINSTIKSACFLIISNKKI